MKNFDEDKVKEVIATVLGVTAERVTSGARFIEDLDADSLDLVEAIMGIEEEFEVEISDEDVEKMSTVGDLLSYLKNK